MERAVIRRDDLARLGAARLAELLAERISALPYREQKRWASRHLPPEQKGQPSAERRPAALLKDIEEFCALSRRGAFVSWVDEHGWNGGLDEGDDGGEFHEWAELFTDFMKEALALTRSDKHKEAGTAYRMLLGLLKEAGETTDILGNHGAPEDSIPLDFSKVIGAYARSLLASRSSRSVDSTFTEILPVATRFWYAGGFAGLAEALDAESRERLKARLSRAVEAGTKTDRLDCPREVEGLIALATVERNQAEVLALKERFASRNAIYLKDALSHYERKRDWASMVRLAQMGIRHFGHHGEYAKALVKAREALGDPLGAQEAQISHFLEEPRAAAFAALRRRSEALSNWEAVFERLLRASESRRRSLYPIRLRILLLLTEGSEHEALAEIAGRGGRMDFDELKFVAKYTVARLSEGVELTAFKKLAELRRRAKRDKEEPYDWLRLVLQKPGTLSQAEYARLAVDMYRQLMDLHLNSGKPSRAAPAAHYGAIVAEVSRLLSEPGLWANLLGHLRQHHGKKRLIWDHLKTEGCPLA